MSEYPLQWPDHWPRTKSPGSSQFKASLSKALSNVENELRLFGKDSDKPVSNLIISSNAVLSRWGGF